MRPVLPSPALSAPCNAAARKFSHWNYARRWIVWAPCSVGSVPMMFWGAFSEDSASANRLQEVQDGGMMRIYHNGSEAMMLSRLTALTLILLVPATASAQALADKVPGD